MTKKSRQPQQNVATAKQIAGLVFSMCKDKQDKYIAAVRSRCTLEMQLDHVKLKLEIAKRASDELSKLENKTHKSQTFGIDPKQLDKPRSPTLSKQLKKWQESIRLHSKLEEIVSRDEAALDALKVTLEKKYLKAKALEEKTETALHSCMTGIPERLSKMGLPTTG